jgi:hypothetical protein
MNIVIKVLGFIHNSTTCIKVNFGVSIRQGESGLCAEAELPITPGGAAAPATVGHRTLPAMDSPASVLACNLKQVCFCPT